MINNRQFRRLIQILLDSSASLFSIGFILSAASLPPLNTMAYAFIGIISLFRLGISYSLGSYQQLWRYSSRIEVKNIALTTGYISLIYAIAKLTNLLSIAYQWLILELLIYASITVSFRMIRRITIPKKNQPDVSTEPVNTLIIGAGKATTQLISEIKRHDPSTRLIGILDDDLKKVGAQIHGVPIIGTTTRLEKFIDLQSVQSVVICMPEAKSTTIQTLVARIRRENIYVKVMPRLHQVAKRSAIQSEYAVTASDFSETSETAYLPKRKSMDPNQNRILITGGAGYIGSHLVNHLLNHGFHVKVLDNFTFGKNSLDTVKDHPNIELINGDIASIRDVVKCVKDVDTIIALAAIVGDPACGLSAEETLNLNYESTKILVETANFYGVKRLVFASSCSVYGASDDQFLTETSQLNPVSLYAKTRIMSEDVILERCGQIEPIILRLSTVFGYSPRMRFDLVVNTLTVRGLVDKSFQIFGGDQWRPFVHCNDAAQAFYLAATTPSSQFQDRIFNVGSTDMNFTLSDVGKKIEALIPDAKASYVQTQDDLRNYKVCFDRIRDQLQFKPTYTLESGITEMINQIKSSKQLQNYNQFHFSNFQTLKAQLDISQ